MNLSDEERRIIVGLEYEKACKTIDKVIEYQTLGHWALLAYSEMTISVQEFSHPKLAVFILIYKLSATTATTIARLMQRKMR